MSDLIERQAAIDVLNVGAELLKRVLDDADVVGAEREKYEWGLGLIESYISDMKELPSTQPETSLMTVTVAPDSEEIERVVRKIKDAPVMVLPSAQPERKKGHWCDCWCSECGWSFEVESGFVGDPTRFLFCPNCGTDMRDNKKEDGE